MSEQPPEDPNRQDPDQQGEDLGTVAEEAAKLFGALGDWAKDQARQQGGEWATGVSGLAEHAATAARQVHDHLGENIANGSPECRYCPVCRTIHVVRQMSPEVRAHLTTAATSLLQAAAGMIWGNTPRSFPPAFSILGYDIGGTRVLFAPNDTFIVLVVVLIVKPTGILGTSLERSRA